jgi:hypothetical protein
MAGRYTKDVDNYAHRTADRYDEAFGVNIVHRATHGNAGDAVRGHDGHSPDAPYEYEPVLPNQLHRDYQKDLRGTARDARGRDQSTGRGRRGR